jgi:hypothetical protein
MFRNVKRMVARSRIENTQKRRCSAGAHALVYRYWWGSAAVAVQDFLKKQDSTPHRFARQAFSARARLAAFVRRQRNHARQQHKRRQDAGVERRILDTIGPWAIQRGRAKVAHLDPAFARTTPLGARRVLARLAAWRNFCDQPSKRQK